MPQFFATAPRGLENVLAKELTSLGFKKVERSVAGCYFESNWAGCYRANILSRISSRILYPVLDFPAYDPEQVYHNILKHDWTKYISPDQTLAVDCKARDSKIRDLRIVSLKTKDAVCDQFVEKFGRRPDVDKDNPDMQISIRLVKNQCTVAIDTSGGTLHERGYRVEGALAPLKENLAAAIIDMTGWTPDQVLLDPMCGSGTLCFEAALKASGNPPRPKDRRYGFQNWKTFQEDAFKAIFEECYGTFHKSQAKGIWGFDRDGRVVTIAQQGVGKLNGSHPIKFEKKTMESLLAPAPTGVLVTNPPYGERLGDQVAAKNTLATLGALLKGPFAEWSAYVLFPEEGSLIEATGMKVLKSFPLYNGSIPCRLYKLR